MYFCLGSSILQTALILQTVQTIDFIGKVDEIVSYSSFLDEIVLYICVFYVNMKNFHQNEKIHETISTRMRKIHETISFLYKKPKYMNQFHQEKNYMKQFYQIKQFHEPILLI